jgi:ribosomal protein S18 acetylase RimI-like enzyme
MHPTYRPARAEELQTAQSLVVRSINDLSVRHGFGPMASVRPAEFQSFSLRDDPDGLWVADINGEIAGFAFSWVCSDFWFLAELFVSPDHQGRGIGDALLKRSFEHAGKSGARNRALITFAFNTVSQALYIRHGLYPRLPIYFFKAEADLVSSRRVGQQLRYSVIADTGADRERLAHLDAHVLGFGRDKHHRLLLRDANITGIFLHDGDDCVGYAYVSAGGQVGPLAVTQPGLMSAAFVTALDLATQTGARDISAFLPGSSDAALNSAVAHGMRITFPMVLVSAHEFGDWRCYLPRNPGFM